MSAGVKLWGKDYANSTAAVEVWIPLKLLPDGSIPVTSSTVIDEGTATGGTWVTLTDTTKNWGLDLMEGKILEVVHAGVSYQRLILQNTANVLYFDPDILPATVDAGDVYRIINQSDPMAPISKGVIHNTAYVTPNNFFGAALAPTIQPTLFRINGAFSVAGVLSVTITRAANTQVVNFNHGVVLTANDLFAFDHLVQDGDTINYRYSVNCTIMTFKVLEIPAAI